MRLECVPNVSEGRRPEVVARLVRAVAAPGVAVLDVSSDPDHNRSVLTLAGEPGALLDGLLALYAEALEAIDLGRQTGVHPRVGAVDVVPFVPLAGAAMSDAIAAAEALGAAVAERFDLPVFLYEEAARRPGRSLPEIRRGGVAGLAARMASADWHPDFGPARLHPRAGATVIGARFFLIAFNVVLAGADLGVAQAIARAVRASSGGLPALRAIGVWLESRGRAQVSLNLLDYRRTSLATALSAVAQEAAARGARVERTELVGLAPEEALLGSLAELLALPSLTPGRVLENRLRETGEDLPRHAVEGA
ncbi:MAG TPA: glutamate formimidoyltransferase [Thermoanaerobaculia bacterium]|nr:glutamate formimidoyltransferase [Thermoanaerobaculia bacterium]